MDERTAGTCSDATRSCAKRMIGQVRRAFERAAERVGDRAAPPSSPDEGRGLQSPPLSDGNERATCSSYIELHVRCTFVAPRRATHGTRRPRPHAHPAGVPHLLALEG